MSSSWPSLRRWAAVAWTLVAALLLVHCQPSARTEPTGGETHFLQRCQEDSADCGTKLACICGVCTLPCDEQSACGDLQAATCVPANSAEKCEGFQAQGHCDLECQLDTDCAESATPLCDAGVCRPTSLVPTCSKSGVTANQVLVVGDSFFALSHQITAYLEELARDAGVLPEGERYRDNSSLLDNALALDGNGIEAQYADGKAEADVKVVVMTGGGADVLLGSCEDPLTADCPLLVNAALAAEQLLARMAEDGVEDVVFAFYPDPADTGLREKVDMLRPLLQGACADHPTRCHWVDLRRAFAGHDDYLADGINPSSAGSRAAAAEIWSAMRQSCVAQ
jgi:hypothetical protein